MKPILSALLFLLVSLPSFAQVQAGPTFAPATGNPYQPPEDVAKDKENALAAGTIQNIYLAYGYTTHIKMNTQYQIQRVTEGGPIVAIKFNKGDNSLDIFPVVKEGETNMNVTINNVAYVFILKITTDQQVMYRRTFTLPAEATDDNSSSAVATRTPPVKPQDIDTTFFVNAMEKSRLDPVYRDSIKTNLETWPLDRVYTWNNCLIQLIEAVRFIRQDVVVLKITWQNTTNRALYLNAKQYHVFIANQEQPVTAAIQDSEVLMPGQQDTAYLFIQGYGIHANQSFELHLPAEAMAVQKVLNYNP